MSRASAFLPFRPPASSTPPPNPPQPELPAGLSDPLSGQLEALLTAPRHLLQHLPTKRRLPGPPQLLWVLAADCRSVRAARPSFQCPRSRLIQHWALAEDSAHWALAEDSAHWALAEDSAHDRLTSPIPSCLARDPACGPPNLQRGMRVSSRNNSWARWKVPSMPLPRACLLPYWTRRSTSPHASRASRPNPVMLGGLMWNRGTFQGDGGGGQPGAGIQQSEPQHVGWCVSFFF